jgi:GGDEF domain-containing protein
MGKILAFFLTFILWSQASAEGPECKQFRIGDSSLMTVTRFADGMMDITCPGHPQSQVLDICLNCLSGGKSGVTGFATGVATMAYGVAYLFKLLVWDAPYAAGSYVGASIRSWFSNDESPAAVASRVANSNNAQQKSLWQKAQDYWHSFTNFVDEMYVNTMNGIEGFKCLSQRQVSEIYCKGVTDVFLSWLTPGKVVAGVRWGRGAAAPLSNFLSRMKIGYGLDTSSILRRFEGAAASLRVGPAPRLITQRGTSKIFENTLADGRKVLRYNRQARNPTGRLVSVTDDVPVNAVNGSIDANTTIGRAVLNDLVGAEAGAGSVVFVDANHLGKVNYFAGGQATGNLYLKAEADAIRGVLREGEMLVSFGGDESVIVLKNNNPEHVREVTQRMINAVSSSPTIRSIFRREVAALSQQYREVNRATSLAGIPENIRHLLNPAQLAEARTSFSQFKTEWLGGQLQKIQAQAMYKGSISAGASTIRAGEALDAPLARANDVANQVKRTYKQRMGFETLKYGENPETALENVLRETSQPGPRFNPTALRPAK